MKYLLAFLAASALLFSAIPDVTKTQVAGRAVSFTVTADGTLPFTYQWRKDGVPIVGATAVTYSIPAVTPKDAGTYSVVVSNEAGSATSGNGILFVSSAPSNIVMVITISTSPANLPSSP